MLRDTFHIKVPIHKDKLKDLVFGMKTRIGISEVLAYFGERKHAIQLMQVLSHGTRAYIYNADGLHCFF